jgi:AcrR family transcriptional regulator
MRNERKNIQRKEEILNAFEALIARYGIDKTTMQEIADSVGISVGTLYNEFEDKDSLIDALISRIEDSFNNKINTIKFGSQAPDEQLIELINAIERLVEAFLKENRSMADYFFSGSKNFRYIGKKIHREFRKGALFLERVKEIIDSGNKSGVFNVDNIDETAATITQAITTIILVRFLLEEREDKTIKKYWDMWFELVVKGLTVK